MSISFDVLDSLHSIRNVDDLKKRWAEDCKRPQRESYKAVEQFVECFLNKKYNDVAEGIAAYFAMSYREAVKRKICFPDDQTWIMPYVRYAESLKNTFENSSYFSGIPRALDVIDGLEKQQLVFNKEHCDTMIEFLDICDECYDGGDYYCSMRYYWCMPENIASYDPWDFGKDFEYEDKLDCWHDCSSIVPFLLEIGNSTGIYFWHLDTAINSWKHIGSFLDKKISDMPIDEKEHIDLLVRQELQKMKSGFPELQNMIEQHLHFKEIVKLLNNDDLPLIERLTKISQLRFPCNFAIKLTYEVEPLIVEYIKSEVQNSWPPSRDLTKCYEQIKSFKHIIADDLFAYCSKIFFTDSIYEAAIREDERKKVLFEMSHSIKNLVASVSEPLTMLQDELSGTQRRTVENALAGAGLIRDLAVGVHMSMRGEAGAWRKDVKEPGFGAATLDKIILDAMRHAVSNMFDGKYFSIFVRNYFARDLDIFMQAQNEWKAAETAEQTFACINKYFFDFKIDCHDTDLKVAVGDRDGTATKLLILFQELFLNAVKYSSFTERENRFVKLDITITADKWDVAISNSAVDRKNVKSSGIGLSVIKNFADLFEAKYDANCKNDTYISNINFSLNK